MIVVDANVITYLVLNSPHSEACSRLFLEDPEWVAPRLWRDELSNVLVTYERRNLLDRQSTLLAFQQASTIIGKNEYDIQIDRILNVAHRTQCSGYDSQYIALAEDLGLQLYTYDQKILDRCPGFSLKPE